MKKVIQSTVACCYYRSIWLGNFVKYKVKNVGKEPKTCMSFADSVIDSEGIQYDDVTKCNMAINSWMMEKVNPNLMKTYEGCFEVPEGAKGFKLKFNCSLEDMYVDLGI